jgi:integrase
VADRLERIPEFIADLRAIPKRETDRIWGRCLAEIKHLRTGKWYPNRGAILNKRGIRDEQGRVYVLGYDDTTLRSVLRDYRNAIREAFGDKHPALRYVKPSAKTQIEVKAEQDERIYAMHNNLRPISCDDLVDTADRLISSPQANAPLVVAAALLLLTGRRPWEILVSGSFERVSEDTLIFAGQAKTRGRESAQIDPYAIPVLTDPDRILTAFKSVRDRYDLTGLDYKAAHNRYSKTLGQYTRQYFADERGQYITPSDLRAAYATIAFEWFAPEDVSLNAYFARILGHSEFDFITSLSYCTFYPIGEKRDFVRDFRRGTKEAIELQQVLLDHEPDAKQREYIQGRINKFEQVLAE